MSAPHADRQAVYESLEPVLGQEAALRIMDYLHFYPERELATSTDIHATTAALRGEMAELRAELRGEMSELRGEMSDLRAELRGEMSELRTELRGEMSELRIDLTADMAGLRSDLTSEMSTRFDQQTRWMVGLISTNLAALIAAVVAVVLAFTM